MSGSESDRWGPRHGPGEARDAGTAGTAEAGQRPASPDTSGRDHLTDTVGQLQAQLDRMAEELSNMQKHVRQAGIDAEEAITAALEDILARIDRGVETTNNEKQERALARLQEQVDDLVARLGQESGSSSREDEVGPVLGRLEEAVRGMAAKAELDQDIVDALTRIETAISGLGDEGRYERRSVLVRLDQLLEAVQATPAQSGPSSDETGDRERLIEKLDGLAEQVETVRRRVALRARPEQVTLDDATVSAVGEAVTEALAAALTNRGGARPKSRTEATWPPEDADGRRPDEEQGEDLPTDHSEHDHSEHDHSERDH